MGPTPSGGGRPELFSGLEALSPSYYAPCSGASPHTSSIWISGARRPQPWPPCSLKDPKTNESTGANQNAGLWPRVRDLQWLQMGVFWASRGAVSPLLSLSGEIRAQSFRKFDISESLIIEGFRISRSFWDFPIRDRILPQPRTTMCVESVRAEIRISGMTILRRE